MAAASFISRCIWASFSPGCAGLAALGTTPECTEMSAAWNFLCAWCARSNEWGMDGSRDSTHASASSKCASSRSSSVSSPVELASDAVSLASTERTDPSCSLGPSDSLIAVGGCSLGASDSLIAVGGRSLGASDSLGAVGGTTSLGADALTADSDRLATDPLAGSGSNSCRMRAASSCAADSLW